MASLRRVCVSSYLPLTNHNNFPLLRLLSTSYVAVGRRALQRLPTNSFSILSPYSPSIFSPLTGGSSSSSSSSVHSSRQLQKVSFSTSTGSDQKQSSKGQWFSMALFGVVSAGLLSFYYYSKSMKEGGGGLFSLITGQQQQNSRTESVGLPDIGGSFTLVDHNGKPTTDLDFRGKYMLVYFGFTFCPDICPTELRKMAQVMNDLKKLGGLEANVQPVFISIDPWRDTVEQIRGYLTEFHPSFLGLTGTPEQTRRVARAYRVYSSRPFEEAATEDEEEDYLVDHTIFMYLMDRQGKFLNYYGQLKSPEEITLSISNYIRTH